MNPNFQSFSLQDVAKMLSVAELTVRRMIKKGELKAAKIGKVYRITMQDLNNFLQKGGSSGFQIEEESVPPEETLIVAEKVNEVEEEAVIDEPSSEIIPGEDDEVEEDDDDDWVEEEDDD